MNSRSLLLPSLLMLLASALTKAHADETPGPAYVPYHANGIYTLGETVGWNVTLPWEAAAVAYVIRKNNLEEISRGMLQPGQPGKIEAKLDEPGMVYVEIAEIIPNAQNKALGAAVAPDKIGAAIPAPKDFDAFWAGKLEALRKVPAQPQLIEKPSEKDGVDFGVLRLNQFDGKHVWAQVARPHEPSGKKKYPALVILEWGAAHPLAKATVTDRAAEGWLAVNVEPHDAMPDQPQSYYDAFPETLKQFYAIESRNRDKDYFLYMYLGNIRAIDYLASRPDWDGRTLVVMGTSMGGQQALCAAGLNPRVTAVLANVPAGADANGVAHGRQVGWPWIWLGKLDAQQLQTAQYFDTVNCARRIKAASLVSFGFIDTLTPPVGDWAMYNAIAGPKEAVPMRDSPHVHLATPAQSMPWTQRATAWLEALRTGQSPIQLAATH